MATALVAAMTIPLGKDYANGSNFNGKTIEDISPKYSIEVEKILDLWKCFI